MNNKGTEQYGLWKVDSCFFLRRHGGQGVRERERERDGDRWEHSIAVGGASDV